MCVCVCVCGGGLVQVQRHLQLRIEAQGKYMQTILEKACQTFAGENHLPLNSSSSSAHAPYNNINKQPNHQGPLHGGASDHDDHDIKDFGPTATSTTHHHHHHLNFPSLQDLNIYGSGDHHQQQQQLGSLQQSQLDMDRSGSSGGGHHQLDGGGGGFNHHNMSQLVGTGGGTNNNKKRPPPSPPYGKNVPAAAASSHLMWSSSTSPPDELRLHQELGTAATGVAASASTSACHHLDPYSINKGDDRHHQHQIYQNIDHGRRHLQTTSNELINNNDLIDSISNSDPNAPLYETKPAAATACGSGILIGGDHAAAMGGGGSDHHHHHQNQKSSSSTTSSSSSKLERPSPRRAAGASLSSAGPVDRMSGLSMISATAARNSPFG